MKTEAEIIEFAKTLADADKANIADGSFVPAITFHTADEKIRLVFFPEIDGDPATRDKIAWATTLLGASIDNLWAVAFAMDTYVGKSQTKHDGSPWGYGGMQHAVLNNTVDADLVSEAFCYQIVERGSVAMVTIPYDRVGTDVEFDFDNVKCMFDGKDGARTKGFFVEMMNQSLDAPKLMDEMKKSGLEFGNMGLDLEAARIHTLAVGVKMVINQLGMNCLVPCHSEEEEEVVRESMDGGPFSDNIKSYSRQEVEEIVDLEQAFKQPAVGE